MRATSEQGAIDLLVQRKGGGKGQRLARARPGAEMFLIGSSSSADFRLSGDGVAGCHTALRLGPDGWTICELSGSERTLADGKSFVERALTLNSPVHLQIGEHALTLVARPRAKALFQNVDRLGHNEEWSAAKDLSAHQVVIRNRIGAVVLTKILQVNEAYVYHDGISERTLPAPSGAEWTTTTIGTKVVLQRLISAQEAVAPLGFALDSGMKRPLMTVAALFLLSFVLMFAFGSKAPSVAALDKKSIDMIYSAKTVKLKRAESVKAAHSRTQSPAAQAQSAALRESPASAAPAQQSTAKASHALASLRASGLSALVGKIAKRASKQGIMIAATGAAPDSGATGPAFFSHGASTFGNGAGAPGKAVASYRVGAVATAGKGGGSAGAARAGTGLSSGKVGMGDVALVDEETVIEGGLDRDVIADVIKRNIGQIRYCYERQLSSNPDLYGKVMVKFTIGASGEVGEPKIDGSTMKSALVEGCILRRLASFKFPFPKGGTNVKVSYPFLFKALQ